MPSPKKFTSGIEHSSLTELASLLSLNVWENVATPLLHCCPLNATPSVKTTEIAAMTHSYPALSVYP